MFCPNANKIQLKLHVPTIFSCNRNTIKVWEGQNLDTIVLIFCMLTVISYNKLRG